MLTKVVLLFISVIFLTRAYKKQKSDFLSQCPSTQLELFGPDFSRFFRLLPPTISNQWLNVQIPGVRMDKSGDLM